MSILFIVNPTAGKGKGAKVVPIIQDMMENQGRIFKIVKTTKPKESIDLAKEGIKQGFEIITAVGGDGTVNEVAEGIMHSEKGKLGIVPAGTGNDFARSLNIPINIRKSIECILKGKVKNIDVGEVNGRSFFNVASIGFDAEIVKNTEKIKRYVKGKLAYTVGLLATLMFYNSKELEIYFDDKRIKMNTLLIAVANGSYYGGGMKISPMAVTDDGYFHTCAIKDISKLKLLLIFPSVFKGNHGKYRKYVSFHKSKTVKVKPLNQVYINIDGELSTAEKEVIFNISNKKLDVIVDCSE